MRPGSDSALTAALAAAGITSFLLARLEFKSENVLIWTGGERLTVHGTDDPLLNGSTFEPMAHGIVLNIGDNSFTSEGSDPLEISVGIPASPSQAIAAASVYPDEYQGRNATLWRAIMIQQPGLGTDAQWTFRRVRSGGMDTVQISNDGSSHLFKLVIEGHASLISAATQSTYMDQKRLDPADRSQDFVAACANGDPAPSKSNSQGFARIGEMYANGRFGTQLLNQR